MNWYKKSLYPTSKGFVNFLEETAGNVWSTGVHYC